MKLSRPPFVLSHWLLRLSNWIGPRKLEQRAQEQERMDAMLGLPNEPPPRGQERRECGCPKDCACSSKKRGACIFHAMGHPLAAPRPAPKGE